MHVEETSDPEETKTPLRKLQRPILDNFSKLTNAQQNVRVKSGVDLIKYLSQKADTEDGAYELKYALKRLIRGLGSSKASTRTGYYSALVALITAADVSLTQILDIINEELLTSGSNSKSEKGEIYTGQVLTCGAIVRSNLFLKGTTQEQEKVIETLVNAGSRRSYLSIPSCTFLINLMESVDQKQFETLVLPHFKNQLTKPFEQLTLDNLQLLLAVKKKFPNVVNKKFVKSCLGVPKIICEDNFKTLANLVVSPFIITLQHPIYEALSKALLEDSSCLIAFLEEVDSCLSRLHRNKLTIVTAFLTHILNNLEDTSVVPELLRKNFIQQTLAYFRLLKGKQKDAEYEQLAQKFFAKLVEILKKDGAEGSTKIAVLEKLLFSPGTFIFEKITKSKLAQQITALLAKDDVRGLGESYRDVVLAKKEKDNPKETWWNNDRLYAAQLLVKLLNHPSVAAEVDWKIEQLKFLMDLGLIKSDGTTSVGVELSASIKDTFFRALDIKLPKLEDLQNVLSELVHHLDSQIQLETLETVLRHPVNQETYELWQKTVHLTDKIKKKLERHRSSTKVVFHTLFLHMGLQLFNNVKLATDSLKELFSCYERIKEEKKRRHEEHSEEKSDDPLWIEVVVDLFLNLLSQNSHLLRSIINCVFPHLCQYLNVTALHQILSVLDPKNEDNPLSHPDSSSESSDEENDDKESETEGDEEESDEERETVNDKLRMAVREALGGNGYQTDEESVDIDAIGEEEGKKLDEALVEAFRQFKPNLGKKSSKQNKEEEALTHFRIRVLDLVDIYLDSDPSMSLTLEIMLPLLQSLEFCVKTDHQKPLQDRVRSSLKKLTNLKKFSSNEDVDETVLGDLLKSLLDKTTKSALVIQDMGDKVAECCIFVVRCSQLLQSAEQTPKKTRKRLKRTINEILTDELELFFKKRDSLTPVILFKNLFQINFDGTLIMLPKLLEFAFNSEIRPFRRNQALDLLRHFYINNRYLMANKESLDASLQEFNADFSEKTINMLENLHLNSQVKEKYVCSLFNLLIAVKRSPLDTEKIEWSEIGEKVREYRSHVALSKDGKVAYKRLCGVLGIPVAVQMTVGQQKMDVVDRKQTGKTEKKRKKMKASKEALKLKKKTKIMRLQGSSDGLLDGISFADSELQEEKLENGLLSDSDGNSKESGNKKKRKHMANGEVKKKLKTS